MLYDSLTFDYPYQNFDLFFEWLRLYNFNLLSSGFDNVLKIARPEWQCSRGIVEAWWPPPNGGGIGFNQGICAFSQWRSRPLLRVHLPLVSTSRKKKKCWPVYVVVSICLKMHHLMSICFFIQDCFSDNRAATLPLRIFRGYFEFIIIY